MKKTFIAILAVAALAACNKAEVIETAPGEAIAFGDAFVDNSTRAAEDPSYGTSNPITEFYVYGTVENVNIYAGETVTKGEAEYGSAWSCTGDKQYWIAGADYVFDAIVGADKVDITTANDTGLPTQIAYTLADQNDMLHERVTTNGKPTDNNGLVTFTFDHLLAKVKMTVTNNTPSTATKYSYTITDITFTNVYTSGNYKVDGTWSDQATGTYGIADIAVASGASQECATEVLLIPGSSIGVSFTVNIKIGNTIVSTTEVAKTALVTPEADKAYSLNLTVGIDDDIQFTVKENVSWTEVTPDIEIE